MKACVVFDTRYGNTEKVARALESGLRRSGIQTSCSSVKEATIGSLREYDLICIGGPTHSRTASESMREFLESMASLELSGRRAFAFDTRRESFLAGSAAKYIEGRLRRQGLMMVNPNVSAIIVSYGPERKREEFSNKGEWREWRHRNEGLREGEVERFEQLGAVLGRALS
jgi:flavodoxin